MWIKWNVLKNGVIISEDEYCAMKLTTRVYYKLTWNSSLNGIYNTLLIEFMYEIFLFERIWEIIAYNGSLY
jgi:hypothetical protein